MELNYVQILKFTNELIFNTLSCISFIYICILHLSFLKKKSKGYIKFGHLDLIVLLHILQLM